MKNQAFTLAEVLVTLGIIGVVSAMTIPTLMRHHQKTVYVNQLKKAYSELTQGFDSALTDTNATDLIEAGFITRNGCRSLFKYFKTTSNFKGYDAEEHFASSYKSIAGNDKTRTRSYLSSWADCAALADGVTFCLAFNPYNEFGYLDVDINGKEGPNVSGRDFYQLLLKSDGTVTVPHWIDEWNIDGVTHSAGGDYGFFLRKIITDGWKMDY